MGVWRRLEIGSRRADYSVIRSRFSWTCHVEAAICANGPAAALQAPQVPDDFSIFDGPGQPCIAQGERAHSMPVTKASRQHSPVQFVSASFQFRNNILDSNGCHDEAEEEKELKAATSECALLMWNPDWGFWDNFPLAQLAIDRGGGGWSVLHLFPPVEFLRDVQARRRADDHAPHPHLAPARVRRRDSA